MGFEPGTLRSNVQYSATWATSVCWVVLPWKRISQLDRDRRRRSLQRITFRMSWQDSHATSIFIDRTHPEGIWLRTHNWEDKKEDKSLVHNGIQTHVSLLWSVCSTSAQQQLPRQIFSLIYKGSMFNGTCECWSTHSTSLRFLFVFVFVFEAHSRRLWIFGWLFFLF